jgi:site-specific DNA-methyltransferase (adenine-specific)
MRSLPDGSVDAVVTDPPYGINVMMHHGRTGERIKERYKTIANDETQEIGEHVSRWAQERGIPTLFFAAPMKPWVGTWDEWLIWNKGPAVGGGGDYLRTHKRTWELIQVRGFPQLLAGRKEAVYTVFASPAGRVHVAEKPVSLMSQLLNQFLPPGSLVLDPFCGSGSTGVACAREGMRFLGMELSEDYATIARRRIADAYAQGKFDFFSEDAL